MEEQIEFKLKTYKAIEKICMAHEDHWNGLKAFNSAFSHFSVKTTQLQMFAFNQTIVLDPVHVNNQRSVVVNPAQLSVNMQLLADEIEDILCHMKEILEAIPEQKTFLQIFTEAVQETKGGFECENN